MNIDERYKKLTILHSNDMHGDFFAEDIDSNLIGGVSMLSGYISKVKKEEENVIYCVAGDMFRGSIIDSEYQGLSTVEIMNMLAPDVVTIGNHETDYGVAHLLFIEKCAKFPIINANLFIKMNNSRLFKPYHIIEIGGMKVLFIGILTEDVIAKTKSDSVIGSLVDINDAIEEITKICNTFRGVDIDFTVLLTHIGIEKDRELAQKLDPELGVDVIVGGHSHTFMEQPEKVNDILIVQAGTGTDQIGRFDIVVDTLSNSVSSYTWQSIPINKDNCPNDERMEEVLSKFKNITDFKYGKVLRRLKCELEHETRYDQTTLGSFLADVFKRAYKVDIVFVGSGSIRTNKLGPIITLSDIMTTYPYKECCYEIKFTGKQLKHVFEHIYRPEARNPKNDLEFYQMSDGIHIVYNTKENKIVKCEYYGSEIDDDGIYSVAIRNYDYASMEKFFDISVDELEKNGKISIITTNVPDVLYEYLDSDEKLPEYPVTNRIEFIE